MVILERDGLRKKISDAEDVHSKQAAALANLQFVLEQFQKRKQVQEDLGKEIMELKSQLEESKQGLQAASRLSDQLELSKKLVGTLKEEVIKHSVSYKMVVREISAGNSG
ncbi:hypothetical protein NQ317_014049 [Molorchus minor]|uniref:RING-type E3 ubiquitin transferase n=1 Tax=Molorchus minor TaxID=1323400 RepID=A0ABQ9JY19_9CUCU|nr:hypothetical protein NQ317_014049 [Molorchus minor]